MSGWFEFPCGCMIRVGSPPHAILFCDLHGAAEEMLAALEIVEWKSYDGYGNYCSECNRYKKHGHSKDCKVGNAIPKRKANR